MTLMARSAVGGPYESSGVGAVGGEAKRAGPLGQLCLAEGSDALLIALLLPRWEGLVPAERLIDDAVWALASPAERIRLMRCNRRCGAAAPGPPRGGGAAKEWLVWHPSGYQLAV